MIRIDDSRQAVAVPSLDADCWTSERSRLPLFVNCGPQRFGGTTEFLAWFAQHRERVDELILEYGGVVLKDSPLRSAEEFDALVAQFPTFERGYVGGSAPRAQVAGKVMEATRMAPEFKINLHQEMAYLKSYPARVAFFCRKPAEQGGETTIGSMREFTVRVPPETRRKLEAHGVRGVRNYGPIGGNGGVAKHSDDMPWDQTFGTRDKAEVAAICASMDMEPHWNEDGSLTVVGYTDAFATHPRTGERFYRNIVHANYLIYEKYTGETLALVDEVRSRQKYPTGYTLGNGEALEREESRALEQSFEDITLGWQWAAGDVMVLDNLQTAHGRNSFVGERETLVALMN